MIRWKKRIRKLTYIFTDMIGLIGAYYIAEIIYSNILGRSHTFSALEIFGLMCIFAISSLTISLALNIYDEALIDENYYSLKFHTKLILMFATSSLIMASSLYIMHVALPRLFLGFFVLSYYGLFNLSKALLLYRFKNVQKQSKSDKRILIVGCSQAGEQYIQEMKKHKYLDFKIIGYVPVGSISTYEDITYLGKLTDLQTIARDNKIDEIAVARSIKYHDGLKEALDDCLAMGITITMLLETNNLHDTKAHVAMVGNQPVLKFHSCSLNESQLFWKRVLDVCGGMVGMMLFAIAYIIVAPLIKLESPGPVIFKQKRVGKNGRVFEIWKFRSMGVNAEAQKAALMANNEMGGHMFKMTNDPRITKIGAFIRKTSIDELPQFYNVLKGDMSLVGTRPPTVNEVKDYEQHHHKRISITPGITGMWQISGRNEISDFEEVVGLDSAYINSWTLWSDIKILFKTVQVVLSKQGSR